MPVLRNSCLACGGEEERELEEDKLVEDKLVEDKLLGVERGREGEHHRLGGLQIDLISLGSQVQKPQHEKIHMVL